MTNEFFDGEKNAFQESGAHAQRPASDAVIDLTFGTAAQSQSLVDPVQLKPDDSFAFRCHRGVSCWNACCHGADVTLTPADILHLSRRLEQRPAEFLGQYTVPAVHEPTGMPIAKLGMHGADGKGPCPFVTAEGCAVHSDRPVTCRYYPLGMVSHKLKDAQKIEDFYFLVREPHCRGHLEPELQSVEEFRRKQGIISYDRINRGWVDILMKLASWKSIGGPMGRAPSLQTKQMFFMVSTDVDRFRGFLAQSRFLQIYDVAAELVERMQVDDEALLQFGFDWLKYVLFNERTIAMRPEVLQPAIAGARAEMGAT